MRDEKLHAVVARSTFPSQNVQSTPGSDHFWKLRRRKIARGCGAKHISKSKCNYKTHQVRTAFGSWMSKKCTPLWREARFQVKMYKAHQVRTTFGSCDVEKLHAVMARSTFRSQNVQNTLLKKHTPLWREAYFQVKSAKKLTGTEHFWTFRCAFAWQAQGIVHLGKSEQNVRVL